MMLDKTLWDAGAFADLGGGVAGVAHHTGENHTLECVEAFDRKDNVSGRLSYRFLG